jgi:formate dehydrogenase major subunit
MFKNIKVENNIPDAADILREINAAAGRPAIAASRRSAAGAHAQPGQVRPGDTARAQGRSGGGRRLLRPAVACWGKPELRHPGSPILYRTDVHVMDGGGTFRARFGTERNGQTLLAENSFTLGSDLTDGYPEFSMAVLKKLGWDKDLTPEELATIRKIGGDKVDTVSLVARPVRRHPARLPAAWRHALWQRQGPGGGLEPAGSRAYPP